MRFKLGRPDLSHYADRFDVPASGPDGGLGVTFLGVASLLLDAGAVLAAAGDGEEVRWWLDRARELDVDPRVTLVTVAATVSSFLVAYALGISLVRWSRMRSSSPGTMYDVWRARPMRPSISKRASLVKICRSAQ